MPETKKHATKRLRNRLGEAFSVATLKTLLQNAKRSVAMFEADLELAKKAAARKRRKVA